MFFFSKVLSTRSSWRESKQPQILTTSHASAKGQQIVTSTKGQQLRRMDSYTALELYRYILIKWHEGRFTQLSVVCLVGFFLLSVIKRWYRNHSEIKSSSTILLSLTCHKFVNAKIKIFFKIVLCLFPRACFNTCAL